MADQNLVTLRSDKNSFLLFEEMDANLLQLKELITEFNVFVDNIFQNHVANFNQLALEFSQFQSDLDTDLLDFVKASEQNTFTEKNYFQNEVHHNGNLFVNENIRVEGDLSAYKNVLFHSATSLRLPIWTTATRPTGSSSTIGFNSDTEEFEGHNGVEWSSVGGSKIEVDDSTDDDLYPLFVDSTSGTAKVVNVDDEKLKYNPAQSKITSGWFVTPTVVNENVTIGAGFSTVSGDKEIPPGVTVEIETGAQWIIA